MITVAMLAALGHHEELRAHLAGALNVGLSRDELVEVLMQVAVYAGVPAAAAPSASPPTSSAPRTPDDTNLRRRTLAGYERRNLVESGGPLQLDVALALGGGDEVAPVVVAEAGGDGADQHLQHRGAGRGGHAEGAAGLDDQPGVLRRQPERELGGRLRVSMLSTMRSR